MTITPEEIARLRALEAKATPGPWTVGPQDPDAPYGPPAVLSPDHPAVKGGEVYEGDTCIGFAGLALTCYDYPSETTQINYELIAAARNAMPRLLDEIERLRDELDFQKRLRVPCECSADDACKFARERDEARADLREAMALLRKGYLLVCAHKAAFQSYAECNDTFCASGFDHEPREEMDKFVDDSDALLAKHKEDA